MSNDPFGPQARKAFEDAKKRNNLGVSTSDAVAKKKVTAFVPSVRSVSSSSPGYPLVLTSSTVGPAEKTSSKTLTPISSTSHEVPPIQETSARSSDVTPISVSQTSITLTPSSHGSRSVENLMQEDRGSMESPRTPERLVSTGSKTLMQSPSLSSPSQSDKKNREKRRSNDKEKQEALQKASFSIEDWKKEKQELKTIAEKYKESSDQKQTLEREIGKWMKETEWKQLKYGDNIIRLCKRKKVPKLSYAEVCKIILTEYDKDKLDLVLEEVDRIISENNKGSDFLLIRKVKRDSSKRKEADPIDLGEDEEDPSID